MNEFLIGMICGAFLMTIVLNQVVRRSVIDVLWLTLKFAIVVVTFSVRVGVASVKAVMGAAEIFVDEMNEREPPDSFFDSCLDQ